MGHIAQSAVLPAFKNAETSELKAFVSGDPVKLRRLARMYGVDQVYNYDEYQDCLRSGEIDAVYIALPNHLHREYVEKAAAAGIHVLCEKPMAVSSADCESMISVANQNQVKLMIAYRLHFEEANLKAIQIVKSGKMGTPKVFNSVFTMPTKGHGIRLSPRNQGGGPTYDIGIYCINAARYLFRDEPIEVAAMSVKSSKKSLSQIEETVSVAMKFPNEKVASFVCSFGAASTGTLQVVGSKGNLVIENAYDYEGEKKLILTVGEKIRSKSFQERDHFGPELAYFSDCILKNKDPEPSGEEGLADIRIIEAIYQSLEQKRPVSLDIRSRMVHPEPRQEIDLPPVRAEGLVKVESPGGKEAA